MVSAMLATRIPDVKVLLVDDRRENLFALGQILQRDGLELISAQSGSAALEELLLHEVALAIIDVQMPEMNGFELAEVMRSAERTRHVPIVFVTAGSHERGSLFRGYEAGAVDFLHKPIEPMVLRNKVETFFELYRQKQQLARQLDLLRDQQLQMQRQNEQLRVVNEELARHGRVLAVARDECRRAQEAAEAANRAKDEFLANVSHEIRTPINAILGMTELVLDTALEAGQRQSLCTVQSAGKLLLGTINELLDFAKLEAGKLELHHSSFALRATVADTLRALGVVAFEKRLEFLCHVHEEVPDGLIGDVARLRQVLVNLVGNAIKFTEKGAVIVEVRLAPDTGSNDELQVSFSVRDTGIGISPEKREAIFRPFEQEDMSTTRRYGGTGLGLTIADRLIGLMRGHLVVDSEPGRGSTFTFTAIMRRAPPTPGDVVAVSPAALVGLRVLIVDDHPMTRAALAAWTREWKMTPVLLDEAPEPRGGDAYAVVLLDARSCHGDSCASLARLRSAGALAGSRFISMTAGEHSRALSEGCDVRVEAHLSKPVLKHELMAALGSLMTEQPRPVVTPSDRHRRTGVDATKPLRVLVAEDSTFNSDLLEAVLATRGHRVEVARTGRQALHLCQAGAYDLLLLDIHMPELDGFQVVQAIRKQEQTTGAHLPVLAVTAGAREEDRKRCLAVGMDGYLAKPISAADLWAAIRRVVA
jgi:signal transduction histidine kinase